MGSAWEKSNEKLLLLAGKGGKVTQNIRFSEEEKLRVLWGKYGEV